jgi:hypothetical protein
MPPPHFPVSKRARVLGARYSCLAAPGPHRTAPVEVQHRNSFDFARLSCWRAATRSATPAATRDATAPSERKEQRRVWGRINAGAALHARLGWALNTQARSDPTQSQSANCPPGVIAFRRVKAGDPYSRGTSGANPFLLPATPSHREAAMDSAGARVQNRPARPAYLSPASVPTDGAPPQLRSWWM